MKMVANLSLLIFFLRYLLPTMVVARMSLGVKCAVMEEVLDGERAGKQGVSYITWKTMDTKQR